MELVSLSLKMTMGGAQAAMYICLLMLSMMEDIMQHLQQLREVKQLQARVQT